MWRINKTKVNMNIDPYWSSVLNGLSAAHVRKLSDFLQSFHSAHGSDAVYNTVEVVSAKVLFVVNLHEQELALTFKASVKQYREIRGM